MDNNQQLRRWPQLTPIPNGPPATSRPSKRWAWNNSNTPSMLTGCVSSDEQTRDIWIQGGMNHQTEFEKGEST